MAQNAGPGVDRITSIEVIGSQRVEPETVFIYMKIQPGDVYDPSEVDASVKSLFESGLFNDVSIRREGSQLFVTVVENPVINQVAFEGNGRINDEQLVAEVQLKPRTIYTRRKVEDDVARILEVYRRSGRFAATVEPKIIELSENRVDLVFEIEEGAVSGIESIEFIGNRAFKDRQLRSVISTKKSAFWRFLSSADRYDPDRIAFDEQLLRDFYRNSGYADFQVSSSVVELTRDQEDFIVTYTVDEGIRYSYGIIEVVSDIRGLDPDDVVGAVRPQTGKWYKASELQATEDGITTIAQARNFPFADIRIVEDKDVSTATIGVTFEIFDGPRIFVERIDIKGNVRTHDRVIRREFDIAEGDPFILSKIRRASRRLESLNFFSEVSVRSRRGSSPDRAVVDVIVAEKSTGSIELSAGFSSRVGPLAQIGFRETNLRGRAQDLRISFTLAAEESQINLNFTEPRFLGRNINAGFDVFRRFTDLGDQSSFDEDTAGASVRMGYNLTPRIRHTVAYRFERSDLKNVQSTASLLIVQQKGVSLQSLVTSEIFYNRLNRRLNPTRGYFASYSVDLAGLGGNVRYVRNVASAGYFKPFFDSNFILGIDGEVGYVQGLGKDVRITDMFFLGGDKLRGFDDSGVGPRDLATLDSVGGKFQVNGTIEMQFPNFLPESIGIKTAVFMDVGVLSGIDGTTPTIVDSGKIRSSVGLGISWASPIGPFRVDFARTLSKEVYDETEGFRVSVGTSF